MEEAQVENRVYIFDTTLRDGEQSPGVNLNTKEKLEIAKQLAKLQVDVIEAGFPIASPGDFEAVRQIARTVQGPAIAGLARANPADIDRAWEAVRDAGRPRIHTFIATSPVHMHYKLRMQPQEVLKRAVEAVKRSRDYCEDVEFSAEDASRSDPDFLCEIFSAVVEAGATVINVPDTVGYAVPEEFAELIRKLRRGVRGIEKIVLSVHCHNDLGMAVANSLAAVTAGANQIECTVNGIGERAGNTALEEIVMAFYTRGDIFGLTTGIATDQIYPTSRMVSSLSGMVVQRNKAVVGSNAFAHESGIHQDGFLKERTTYEIMTPQTIGLPTSKLVLGKHSGRHAFRNRLEELGISLPDEEINRAFQAFKDLADKKKEVTDRDLEALVGGKIIAVPEVFRLDYFHIVSGNSTLPTATVRLVADERIFEEAACGNGPVDAVYKTIDRITGIQTTLEEYSLRAVTEGKDALGEVTVKIRDNGKIFTGRGTSTDVLEASAKAYVHALNKLVADWKILGRWPRPVQEIDQEGAAGGSRTGKAAG
ncbi:MAG: 2-isopropylmalate synthase [Firmicutes bacterium]|nr:2-isopropylmalate synthase [Bacillota bacterium]